MLLHPSYRYVLFILGLRDQSGRASGVAIQTTKGWLANRCSAELLEQEMLLFFLPDKLRTIVEEQLRRKHRFLPAAGQ